MDVIHFARAKTGPPIWLTIVAVLTLLSACGVGVQQKPDPYVFSINFAERHPNDATVTQLRDLAQVFGSYGHAEAQTIVENCGNSLILRCSASENGGTARFASKLIGEREVFRDQVTNSARNTSRSPQCSPARLNSSQAYKDI